MPVRTPRSRRSPTPVPSRAARVPRHGRGHWRPRSARRPRVEVPLELPAVIEKSGMKWLIRSLAASQSRRQLEWYQDAAAALTLVSVTSPCRGNSRRVASGTGVGERRGSAASRSGMAALPPSTDCSNALACPLLTSRCGKSRSVRFCTRWRPRQMKSTRTQSIRRERRAAARGIPISGVRPACDHASCMSSVGGGDSLSLDVRAGARAAPPGEVHWTAGGGLMVPGAPKPDTSTG